MMISAEMFRAAHENDSIFDLLTERDQLVEEILTFESEAEILTGAPDNSGTSFDDGWDDSPTRPRSTAAIWNTCSRCSTFCSRTSRIATARNASGRSR